MWFVYSHGYTLYYGDAESHLDHARRLFDSRTPGPNQVGTPWLPLPHALTALLVMDDHLWRTGLAGAIPAAVCFTLAGAFLFASAKMAFDGRAAAFTALAALAFNPNLLYLQSTPMTEPIFLACLMALLYFTILFGRTQSILAAAAAGVAAVAGELTRYEGWFLIPFVAVYFLIAAKRRRILTCAIFTLLAVTAPIAWLAHNWWYMGDALAFFRGPSSARAIQGARAYPGAYDWTQAWLQFRAAAIATVGPALLATGLIGIAGALAKKVIWPLALLALPGVFYIWSVHSGGTPIRVPTPAAPSSYYNTRYGLALLPLAAFASAAIVAWTPLRFRAIAAVLIIGIGLTPWMLHPRLESVITWKESQVNSVSRRAWTREAAGFLRANYQPGTGVFTTFGDVTGVFREAGIPLRDTLTWDIWPGWWAAKTRPDLFLREEWAVAFAGDPVQSTINHAFRRGPRYTLQKVIAVKGADVMEIYRLESRHGIATESQ